MKKLLVGFIFILALGVLAACGPSSANEKDNNGSDNGAAGLEGSVVIDGSGTVYPLMAAVAESYMTDKEENVSVEVSRAGTSAGFKKFLVEDGTDFNDASRQIKDEEAALAEELGIEVKELKVALDGLTFVVHKDNDWATEMTAEDLKKVFLADSDVVKWSDIDPEWPDEEISLYGPNENHGTYEFFFESILEENDLKDSVNLQQEYSSLVNLISEDVNGIGFFGFGYYVNNTDKLQAVHVDFGNGAVEPTLTTIAEDGDYADFTRPVFTYLNVNLAKEKPQVLDFATYLLENMNEFAGETGFAPIPEDEVAENLTFLGDLK